MRNSSFLKKIPNFVPHSNRRGDDYDYYDDLDFNTPHSFVDDQEINIPDETWLQTRPRRLRKPTPKYNDYVLY